MTARPTATPAATLAPEPTEPETGTRPTSGATPSATTLTGRDGVIVFAGRRGGSSDIWAVRPDGTGLARITNSPDVDERSPSVSADGTRIVYAVGAEPDREIWLIDMAGNGRPQRLTTDPADDYAPAISPDGRHIAWVSNRTDRRFTTSG